MLADIEQGHHVLETSLLPMQHENFKVCLCMCMCVYGGVRTCYSAHVDVRESTALHISPHLPSSLKQDLLFFCCEYPISWITSLQGFSQLCLPSCCRSTSITNAYIHVCLLCVLCIQTWVFTVSQLSPLPSCRQWLIYPILQVRIH